MRAFCVFVLFNQEYSDLSMTGMALHGFEESKRSDFSCSHPTSSPFSILPAGSIHFSYFSVYLTNNIERSAPDPLEVFVSSTGLSPLHDLDMARRSLDPPSPVYDSGKSDIPGLHLPGHQMDLPGCIHQRMATQSTRQMMFF